MNHHKLERWSFAWSELRLIIAAVALFLQGVPPIVFLIAAVPSLLGPMYVLLNVAWLISGATAAYLLYRFFTTGRRVFGGSKPLDLAAFAVMVVSGLNLGLTALVGQNLGMSIFNQQFILAATGALYVATVIYLHRRYNAHGKKLF